MTSQAKDWLEHAKLDIEAAHAILENPRLTSISAFHCQQAIEKALKALILHFTSAIPRIHNIVSLLATTKNYCSIDADIKAVIMLNQSYTDTRYPREISEEALMLPSHETAVFLLITAENVVEQAQNILESK